MHDPDILVVGAGPVGMLVALGLAQAGARVAIIEAEARINDSPRAAVYHWSVLEGLERLGIREEAEAIGFVKQDYCYRIRRTGERIGYDVRILEGRTPYPYNVHLGQDKLAEIARRRLEALPNAAIRFDTRLTGLAQDANGVTAQVEGQDDPEEIRAKWVIGADGAASTVRKLLGLPFEGMTWPERFVATNVFFDFTQQGDALTQLLIDDRWGAVIVKIDRNGLWRCTYMEDASLPEETYMERLPAAYRELLGEDARYRLDRAAPYRMHQRSAPRYRNGRVLLAGDAAHVTNPTGGLGLTSGLFDAYALWPALVAVALDGADDAVLDRYSDARRRSFLDLVSPGAIAMKRLVFHADGGGAALDAAVERLRLLARDPGVLLERLMFFKSLETPPLLGAPAL